MDGTFDHRLKAVQPIILHTAFKADKARMMSLDELDHVNPDAPNSVEPLFATMLQAQCVTLWARLLTHRCVCRP